MRALVREARESANRAVDANSERTSSGATTAHVSDVRFKEAIDSLATVVDKLIDEAEAHR